MSEVVVVMEDDNKQSIDWQYYGCDGGGGLVPTG